LFQRFALLVKSVLGLLVGLKRRRWRIPAWNLCVLMLLIPKIRPWWETINSTWRLEKSNLEHKTSNAKVKLAIQTYKI